ncbi:ferrous iron transport protein FeoC [Cronobacter sakazakii]|nr:ferrous iron transport protein FeoC [Cronobacter sakazakii]
MATLIEVRDLLALSGRMDAQRISEQLATAAAAGQRDAQSPGSDGKSGTSGGVAVGLPER